MAAKKKPTAKQITEELRRAAKDFEHLRDKLWDGMLTNVARRLDVEEEEIYDEFGALT